MTTEARQSKESKISLEKLKKGFQTVEEYVNSAVYTDFFIVAILAVAFITWVTECAPFGFVTMAIVISFVLVFSHDILPLFAMIFSSALMLYTKNTAELLHLWPVLIPVGIALVVFFVRNIARKVKNKDKFRLGKMFFPQLAVSAVLLLGGVGVVSAERYVASLPNIMGLGVAVLVVYMLARNFISRDGDVDRTTYFAKVLAYIGVVVALELVVAIAERHVPATEWAKVYWHVGWGNRNNISTYLLFTAPMCLYLALKNQRYSVLYLLLGAFQYICLVMTFSRGGILFGFIALVVGGVLLVLLSENKKHQLISIAIVLGAVLVFYLSCMKGVHDVLNSLRSRGTGLSGRESLYAEAMRVFKDNPFQGNGLGYVGGRGLFGDAVQMYWFHSTFSQVIACMGVLGLVAYAYSYGVKIWLLVKNIFNPFNLFVVVVFLGFEGYSMMDTGTFIPGGYPLIVIILMCLVEMFTSTTEVIAKDKESMKALFKRDKRKESAKDEITDEGMANVDAKIVIEDAEETDDVNVKLANDENRQNSKTNSL